MHRLLFLCTLLLAFAVAASAAPDPDNTGVLGDEPEFARPEYDGIADRDGIVVFPTAADTWDVLYYPYWWNVGDTVYGIHDPGGGAVTHADVTLKISYNVLSGSGHVDLAFQIDGVTVGTVTITAADGLGYVTESFDFPAVTPPFELRWYETNTVEPGLGSISLDETGECMVAFTSTVPTEAQTWSGIKQLYE